MAADDWSPLATVYDPLKAGSIDGTDEVPHDRAVWRAMCASYRPNKAIQGNPHCTVFVSRLSPETTEESLEHTFDHYGEIKRIRLVRDIVTGFSKCYAFIEYKDERSAQKACRDSTNIMVDDHKVFVDMEQERTLKGWIPRRLGGGFGGKKESGQLRFGGLDRPFKKPIDLLKYTRGRENLGYRPNRDSHKEREHSRERPRHYDRSGGRDEDYRPRSRSPHRDRHRTRDRPRGTTSREDNQEKERLDRAGRF